VIQKLLVVLAFILEIKYISRYKNSEVEHYSLTFRPPTTHEEYFVIRAGPYWSVIELEIQIETPRRALNTEDTFIQSKFNSINCKDGR
jgi:hypothetical protein